MKLYLAGPMRGIPAFNFPAFDDAFWRLTLAGHIVFSPAERDRATGFDPSDMDGNEDLAALGFSLREALSADLRYITEEADAVVLLPGWEKSSGATAEVATARALGIPAYELADFLACGAWAASQADRVRVTGPAFTPRTGKRRTERGRQGVKDNRTRKRIVDALKANGAAQAETEAVAEQVREYHRTRRGLLHGFTAQELAESRAHTAPIEYGTDWREHARTVMAEDPERPSRDERPETAAEYIGRGINRRVTERFASELLGANPALGARASFTMFDECAGVTGDELEAAMGRAVADAPERYTGERRVIDPETGGAKGQKDVQLGAVDPLALEEVGRLAGFGSTKYERGNYLKGYAWSLSVDALYRHFLAFQRGEDRDEESGVLHVAAVAWHGLALCSFMLRGLGTDDRFPPPPELPGQHVDTPGVDMGADGTKYGPLPEPARWQDRDGAIWAEVGPKTLRVVVHSDGTPTKGDPAPWSLIAGMWGPLVPVAP